MYFTPKFGCLTVVVFIGILGLFKYLDVTMGKGGGGGCILERFREGGGCVRKFVSKCGMGFFGGWLGSWGSGFTWIDRVVRVVREVRSCRSIGCII